jgi:hypothetical protein
VGKAAVVILLVFAVSVTPSVSDAIQLHETDPRYTPMVIGWWLVLFTLLCLHWRALA